MTKSYRDIFMNDYLYTQYGISVINTKRDQLNSRCFMAKFSLVITWRHARCFLENPVEIDGAVKARLVGNRRNSIVIPADDLFTCLIDTHFIQEVIVRFTRVLFEVLAKCMRGNMGNGSNFVQCNILCIIFEGVLKNVIHPVPFRF